MLVRAMARRLSSTGRLSCYERPSCILRSASTTTNTPLVICGSGVAGCATALIAAQRYSIPSKLIFAGSLAQDCNSYWAQGGIIYRNYNPNSGDSAESLVHDILRAGAGLSVEKAAWKLATQGPDRVKELLLDPTNVFANVPFDRNENGELSLCLEASHAAPRIIHHADHTGKLITQHITAAAARHPLIELVPNTLVTDLLVSDKQECLGIQTLNRLSGEINTISSRATVLAAGGLGGIYQHSTNPSGFNALGSSVALAERVGVATQDLEYVQFHPTSLYMPEEARFLLTEALRGEGAILRNSDGRAFARDFHVNGELAPRDVVARGVFEESQRGNVFLDISHRNAEWLHKRFPSIQAHLKKRGLDIAQKGGLPVIPAAHYTCGGIATDLNGCTSLQGLYAAGEAARTGVHGGNRLASTSLLEGLVFGASVADHFGENYNDNAVGGKSHDDDYDVMVEEKKDLHHTFNTTTLDKKATIQRATHLLQSLKKTMWDHVGVVRSPSGLQKALQELGEIKEEAQALYELFPVVETVALRDASCSGMAVAKAAHENRTSAGAHCIVDDDDEEEEEDLIEAQAVN